ncbi:hypothetical protein [Mesorhizobium sp. SP-1A]|uniref:hypothetical protein n=1 Tax=Mesorhizobium sp. SP-1A TaxID=3077840 RepID=UPI0028F73E48|nr:hypothetical protein [Mesorhizobium sp. SP-1A]
MPKTRHPQDVPLNEWTDGWLQLSLANHLGAKYLFAHNHEKAENGWPVSHDEMVAFLIDKGEVPQAGTGLPEASSN